MEYLRCNTTIQANERKYKCISPLPMFGLYRVTQMAQGRKDLKSKGQEGSNISV